MNTSRAGKLPNYIVFDIDGVFSPNMAQDILDRGMTCYNDGWITWWLDIPTHGAWVRELETYADLIWGSNWHEESNKLAKIFELSSSQYPHIDLFFGAGSDAATWKLPPVRHWFESTGSSSQKVVWFEDEIFDDAKNWAESHPNVLLIHTDPAVGITSEQVLEAKNFLS